MQQQQKHPRYCFQSPNQNFKTLITHTLLEILNSLEDWFLTNSASDLDKVIKIFTAFQQIVSPTYLFC